MDTLYRPLSVHGSSRRSNNPNSLFLVRIFYKKIPKSYDARLVDILAWSTPIKPNLLKVCLATLVAIDVGYVAASLAMVPVSIVICSGALFLLVVYMSSLNGEIVRGERKGLRGLAQDINWDIVLFMLSIFLVVQGLENAGITQLLSLALVSANSLPSALGIITPSMIVTAGASFMNNWPMTILGLMSIEQAATTVTLSGQEFTGLVFQTSSATTWDLTFSPRLTGDSDVARDYEARALTSVFGAI